MSKKNVYALFLLWNNHVNKKMENIEGPLGSVIETHFFVVVSFHTIVFSVSIKAWRKGGQDVQRLIKSTCGVYCGTMFHVAEAEIIRQINMVDTRWSRTQGFKVGVIW